MTEIKTEKWKKIVILAASALTLGMLAWRYPVMKALVPIQYGVDGTVNRAIPKALFAGVLAAGVLGFDIISLLNRRSSPIQTRGVVIFCLLCVVVTVLSIFA